MARPKKVAVAKTSAAKAAAPKQRTISAATKEWLESTADRQEAKAIAAGIAGAEAAEAKLGTVVLGSYTKETPSGVKTVHMKEELVASLETKEPDGPMSLADVNAILADNYPGFEPTNVRGEAAGLKFALPGGGSITVERAKIKKCANMEELRAYIDSVK